MSLPDVATAPLRRHAVELSGLFLMATTCTVLGVPSISILSRDPSF